MAGTDASHARLAGLPGRRLPRAALLALGVALYARGFGVGFVGDDYTLLDAALRAPLLELLSGRLGILGYYRPISRELYFWIFGHLAGPNPIAFHAVNALTYGAVVAMLWTFLARWLGERAAAFGALAFVVFPPGGALTSWVSCAQDVIALFWSMAALLCYQARRFRLAGLAVLLAALSKETAGVMLGVLAAYDWATSERAGLRERARRLAPALLGLAIAIAIAIAVRATWPPGTSVAIWSPRQMAGASGLPLDFLRTMWPPDTMTGIAHAWSAMPLVCVAVLALAALAVPGATGGHADEGAGSDARVLAFAAALTILGMLPVAMILERWRGYFFCFAALGTSVAAGALFARSWPWIPRIAFASAALVNFGANSFYRPVSAAYAPAHHPHVNYTFFKENADLTRAALDTVTPYCDALRATPRVFVVGPLQGDAFFDNLPGPGLRVTCRDTVARLRPLEALTAADARSSFGLLTIDPGTLRVGFERADSTTRERVAENLLLMRAFDPAAACFEAAASEHPDLMYAFASSLAAAGKTAAARDAWRSAVTHGSAPSPDAVTVRWLATVAPGRADTARATLRRLVGAALADPADAAGHEALGHELLSLENAEQGTIELTIAYGIGRSGDVLVAVASGLEAMAQLDEARRAYAEALRLALTPAARERAMERLRGMGGG